MCANNFNLLGFARNARNGLGCRLHEIWRWKSFFLGGGVEDMFEKEGPPALQHCSVELRATSRVAGWNSGAVWCDKLNLEVLAPYSCNVVDCFFIRNYCIICFVLNGKHQVYRCGQGYCCSLSCGFLLSNAVASGYFWLHVVFRNKWCTVIELFEGTCVSGVIVYINLLKVCMVCFFWMS
jgi:hypothetical protein